MTLSETKTYLSGLTLAQALWWFTENIGEGHKHRSELFFFLRARMVTYSARPLTDAQIDALDTFALHWLYAATTQERP